MICAFTGHRQLAASFNGALFRRALVNLIEICGADTFFDGMARGFDLLAATEIIDLKSQYKIKLVACVPFGGQIQTMRPEDREIYEMVIENCDDVNVLSADYYPGCMYARNRFMVDNADVVFAHFSGGSKGGTYYTVSYAKKCGKRIILI